MKFETVVLTSLHDPTDQSAQNIPQTCSGCGRFYLPHQLHTCPSCGKQYCDKCYPDHNCQKPRPPKPNPHIVLDQQEWYNKQPTPCDRCGKIYRADALRKVGTQKICPDCILESTRQQQKQKNRSTLLTALIAVIIIALIAFLFFGPPGLQHDFLPAPTPLPTQVATLSPQTLPTALPSPTFNTAGTIHLGFFPDLSKYNPPSLTATGGDPAAEQLAADYNKWRSAYLADLAEYQLHLGNIQFDTSNTIYTGTWTEFSIENDKLEKYRPEINRLGKSLNGYLNDYNTITSTTNKISWRHQDLPALQRV